MPVLAFFLGAVADILGTVIFIYTIVVIVSAVLSWVNPDPYNPLVQIIRRLTTPVYQWIRKFIPTIFGGIDFAPIILLLTLQFLDGFVVRSLKYFAQELI